jgi:hypothetical protein
VPTVANLDRAEELWLIGFQGYEVIQSGVACSSSSVPPCLPQQSVCLLCVLACLEQSIFIRAIYWIWHQQLRRLTLGMR